MKGSERIVSKWVEKPGRCIWSPMPSGSGAIEIHRHLANCIEGYQLRPFDPRREYFPPALVALRDHRFGLVHTTPDCGALVAAASQPLVVTFHNFVLDADSLAFASPAQSLYYRTGLRWLTFAALKRAAAVAAVSEFVAARVREHLLPKQPIHVIPNGVDTSLFSPSRARVRSRIRVLFSGNASRRKGAHLLAAIATGVSPAVEIHCTVGERELLRYGGIPHNLRCIGKQPAEAMPAIYSQYDMLLMPTAREGFGLAVAEAMASGLPVVASNTSTMPDLVVNERGGLLCSLGDVASFSASINRLAANEALRHEMGDFNRRRAVAQFSLERMCGLYRELFDEVRARSSSS